MSCTTVTCFYSKLLGAHETRSLPNCQDRPQLAQASGLFFFSAMFLEHIAANELAESCRHVYMPEHWLLVLFSFIYLNLAVFIAVDLPFQTRDRRAVSLRRTCCSMQQAPPPAWPGRAVVEPGRRSWDGPKPISIVGSTGSIGTQVNGTSRSKINGWKLILHTFFISVSCASTSMFGQLVHLRVNVWPIYLMIRVDPFKINQHVLSYSLKLVGHENATFIFCGTNSVLSFLFFA